MDSAEQRSRRNASLFFVAAAVVLWLLPVDWNTFPAIITSLIAAGAGIYWLATPQPRTDPAPDLLAEEFDSYFERDGLCFAARLETRDGLCFFDIFCQNQWSGECEGTIYFIPMEGTSPDGAHDVPPIETDVTLDGGEVGVISIPYLISEAWQGRVMIYDVYADSIYPNGRGALLRSRHGLEMDTRSSALGKALKTAALLAVHHVKVRNASIELKLPFEVAEDIPKDVVTTTDSLWQMPSPNQAVKPA
jgi:hypothetical protein